MKKYLILWSAALIVTCSADAKQDRDLSVNLIDKALLPDADAVIRFSEEEIQVVSQKEVVYKWHYAITVLKEKGAELAMFDQDFSSLNKMSKLSGAVYDKFGKEIKKLNEDDFMNASATALQAAYYGDERKMLYKVDLDQYPYTVEYNLVIKQSHTLQIPDVSFQPSPRCAIQEASLKVTLPKEMPLRYKLVAVNDVQPIKDYENYSYLWSVKSVNAFDPESLNFDYENKMPAIYLALNSIQFSNYSGSNTDWASFGKFVYDLNKGRDILPEDEKRKVRDLTSGAKTNKEKIDILYKYLQSTTRYVSMQYGIGGWQTMDAEFLAKNKYGDCKALTNYMKALLHEVGIEAVPALIYAGSDNRHKILKDFPNNQFNHVILHIPGENNGCQWLECTSQDLPAGYLGSFTDDRDALLITPAGGKLIHTPVYDTAQNKMRRHAVADLAADGTINVKMVNFYTGLPAIDVFEKTNNVPERELNKYANGKYKIPTYSVNASKYTRDDKVGNIGMGEYLSFSTSSLVTKAGGYMFLAADLAPFGLPSLTDDPATRKSTFCLSQSIDICDTFEFNIPDKLKMESAPEPVKMSYPFGSYSCEVKQEDKKIIVLRRFALFKGVYQPVAFAGYKKLLEDINKGSGQKIALKNL